MSEQDDGEVNQNPIECECPNCSRGKMNGTRFCIRCYTDCKSAGFSVSPAHD